MKVELFPYGAFLKDLGVLVVADLHLGIEEYLDSQGLHLPYSQLPDMEDMIIEALDRYDPDGLILLGDVKHEFARASDQEWRDVRDLISTLKRRVRVEVVRGNHDNYLIPILRKMDVPLHDPMLDLGDVKLVHGHREVELEGTVVMGHEHPGISLRKDFGAKVTFKCMLHGAFEDFEVFVLPAATTIGGAKDVLSSEPLSPILKKLDLSTMEVHVVDEVAGVRKLGTLRDLLRVLQSQRW